MSHPAHKPAARPPKLLEQMRNQLRRDHLSLDTEKGTPGRPVRP